MDILFILLFFGMGLVIGWIRATNFILGKIISDPEGFLNALKQANLHDNEIEAEIKTDERFLKIEKIEGQLYLYDKETNDFLAQGTTLEDALEKVQKRFPGKRFQGLLSKEDADSLGITVK